MTERTAGDVVVDVLARSGVEVVFGIPSVHNLPIYDAIRRDSRVRADDRPARCVLDLDRSGSRERHGGPTREDDASCIGNLSWDPDVRVLCR